jgi:hypothetical protein
MLRRKRLEYALVALSSLATLGAGGERPIRGGISPERMRRRGTEAQ